MSYLFTNFLYLEEIGNECGLSFMTSFYKISTQSKNLGILEINVTKCYIGNVVKVRERGQL